MTTPTPRTDAVETKHGLAWFGLHDEQGRYLDGMVKFRELSRQLERELAAAQEALELASAERSSAAEAAGILFDYLGWKSGGLGSAAIETVQRAQAAEARAESYRKLLAETLKPGAYGIGSTLAQRIYAAIRRGE